MAYLDFSEAQAFCRWLGKRLPTSDEWEKAARGGLTLDAAGQRLNPAPRRAVPWGGPIPVAPPANLSGGTHKGPAAVGAFPGDRGPYGHLDLAGNLHEWTTTRPPDEPNPRLRVVRGSHWSAAPESQEFTIPFTNMRERRHLSFSMGFRCAADL